MYFECMLLQTDLPVFSPLPTDSAVLPCENSVPALLQREDGHGSLCWIDHILVCTSVYHWQMMGLHPFSCLKLYCERLWYCCEAKTIKSVRLILAGNDYENNIPLKKKKKKRSACYRIIHRYDVLAKLKWFVEINFLQQIGYTAVFLFLYCLWHKTKVVSCCISQTLPQAHPNQDQFIQNQGCWFGNYWLLVNELSDYHWQISSVAHQLHNC